MVKKICQIVSAFLIAVLCCCVQVKDNSLFSSSTLIESTKQSDMPTQTEFIGLPAKTANVSADSTAVPVTRPQLIQAESEETLEGVENEVRDVIREYMRATQRSDDDKHNDWPHLSVVQDMVSKKGIYELKWNNVNSLLANYSYYERALSKTYLNGDIIGAMFFPAIRSFSNEADLKELISKIPITYIDKPDVCFWDLKWDETELNYIIEHGDKILADGVRLSKEICTENLDGQGFIVGQDDFIYVKDYANGNYDFEWFIFQREDGKFKFKSTIWFRTKH